MNERKNNLPLLGAESLDALIKLLRQVPDKYVYVMGYVDDNGDIKSDQQNNGISHYVIISDVVLDSACRPNVIVREICSLTSIAAVFLR